MPYPFHKNPLNGGNNKNGSNSSNNNGSSPKTNAPINREEIIQFPTDYPIKVIVEFKKSDNIYQASIFAVLFQLGIQHNNWRVKESSKAKYRSYSIDLVLENRSQFDNVYVFLSKIPDVVKVI